MVTRTVPTQQTSNFDRTYIWPGVYLAELKEIKESRDDGKRFTKSYTDRETGEEIIRDALVLIFEILQPVGVDPLASDGSSTKEDRIANIGETIGKKVTDSLHEKSNLYAYYTAITGAPPAKGKPIELSDMLNVPCLITIQDNSLYLQNGDYAWRSFVLTVTQFIEVGEVAKRPKGTPPAVAASGPTTPQRAVPAAPAAPARPASKPVPAGPPPSKDHVTRDPYDNVPDDLSEAVDF